MTVGERIQERLTDLGMSQNALAATVGISTQTIWKLVNGQSNSSSHLHKIARALQTTPEYLDGETDDPSLSGELADRRLGFRGAELEQPDLTGMAMVKETNLELGFGGSFLDSPVEERLIPFPADWLRQFTDSAPEHLAFIRGRGTSMSPTMQDGDLCLLDLSRKRLDEQDELWAVAYGEIGMIKRLRKMPDGTVKLMSDNQAVSDEFATDGELYIIGRCCGVFGKR